MAFSEGNPKIGLRQAIDSVPYYHRQAPVFLSSTPKWWSR